MTCGLESAGLTFKGDRNCKKNIFQIDRSIDNFKKKSVCQFIRKLFRVLFRTFVQAFDSHLHKYISGRRRREAEID